MKTCEIKAKLVHALTDYDSKQSKKRGYNPHALGIYFQRIDEVCTDVENGQLARAALLNGFSDRLLDVCLVAIGEPKFTADEATAAPVAYQPFVSSRKS